MAYLKTKTLVVLLFFSLVILFLDNLKILNPLKSLLELGIVPIEYQLHSINNGVTDTFSFLTFWKSGEARIKNLEQRNLELLSQASRADTLEKENQELRYQLGVKSLLNRTLLPAAVLGISRYMQIGVGAKDQVRENMTVVYLGNLVGRVIQVAPRTSLVELPTDAGAKIPVKIKSTSNIRGLALGQFNSSILLDKIAQNEEIKPDDLVLTTGEGKDTVSNSDLVVGKINTLTNKETGLFRQASIKSLIDYQQLTTVFVILD